MAGARNAGFLRRILLGFLAGALGVLLFHQAMVWGLTGRMPWSNWRPVAPLGVPAILNAAFWGGMWGIVFALVADRFPRGVAYLLAAFAFGAIFPTLVSWFVVPLVKGGALGPRGVWYNGFLINGAWGIGTAICLGALRRTMR